LIIHVKGPVRLARAWSGFGVLAAVEHAETAITVNLDHCQSFRV
jgi:hypothetical protein